MLRSDPSAPVQQVGSAILFPPAVTEEFGAVIVTRTDGTGTDDCGHYPRYTIRSTVPTTKGDQVENDPAGLQDLTAYELNDRSVAPGTKIRARFRSWTNCGPVYEFSVTGTSSGGGFHARITASELVDEAVYYRIEEIELDPDTKLYRAKDGGRVGPAFRGPTEEVDPPPVPVGQGVFAVESATLTLAEAPEEVVEDGDTGVYEITPWGGHFRRSIDVIVGIESNIVFNPEDCGTGVVTVLAITQRIRIGADGLCVGYSPAGES